MTDRLVHIPDHDVVVPPGCIEERFIAGYYHGLNGKNLAEPEHYRRSFRLGFRQAKLRIQEERKKLYRNVHSFPGRVKIVTK